jgi:GNAT superfamily N-acetyltransferase
VIVVQTVPVTAEVWPALAGLFGRGGASNGCWCMYWILGPDYHRRARELNRDALRQSATDGPPPGLLALEGDGTALGWCRLTPRADLPWLSDRLPRVDDMAVWSLPCFYVRRGTRRLGVMTALIERAVEEARAAEAPALEAYPVDTSVPGSTRNLFTGTVSVFEKAGFAIVARQGTARPIMRYHLTSNHDPRR